MKVLRAALRLLVVPFLLAVIGVLYLLPARLSAPLFYRNRRPTGAGRFLNSCWSWLVSTGLTPAVWPGRPVIGPATLEVRGRRSGKPRSNMVTWVEHEGQRYFVSMLGPDSEWVRNVKAAGGEAVFRHGERRRVRLEEVPVSERAPIIQAWYQRTWRSTRPHLGIDPEAGIGEFGRLAPEHPVYRIVSVEQS